MYISNEVQGWNFKFAPSQREAALLCHDISHWLGANLELALDLVYLPSNLTSGIVLMIKMMLILCGIVPRIKMMLKSCNCHLHSMWRAGCSEVFWNIYTSVGDGGMMMQRYYVDWLAPGVLPCLHLHIRCSLAAAAAKMGAGAISRSAAVVPTKPLPCTFERISWIILVVPNYSPATIPPA